MTAHAIPAEPAYRHRQWGWIAIASAAVPNGLMAWLVVTRGLWPAAFAVLVVTTVVLLLFGWLTVTVGRDAIAAHFGVGLIHRRVALGAVRGFGSGLVWPNLTTTRGFRAVRNPWYYGWGIRLIPAGWLFNVSGLAALEIDLPEGRRVRIGTNEPERLVDAVSRVVDRSPSSPSEDARAYRTRAAGVIAAVVIGTVVVVVVTVVLRAVPP